MFTQNGSERKNMSWFLLVLLFLMLFAVPGFPGVGSLTKMPSGSTILAVSSAATAFSASAAPTTVADKVVHDLCGRSVALLGESPLHGFGRTLEFKIVLVRRLIDECHYNAVFFESGIYDFLNIQKKLKSGEAVTEPMLATAIGGLWATREVQPLIPFLVDRLKTGAVTVGGLDDQLARGTYAQHEMSSDLVAYLPGDAKVRCLAVLQKHTFWQYTDESPYSPKDKSLILGCLNEIETRVSKAPPAEAPSGEYDLAVIDSLKRTLARDFRQGVPAGMDMDTLDGNERDRSMYLNLQWFVSRLPSNSKIIIWAATTHVAKDLSGVDGEEHRVPLGSYVHHDFKGRAFALGFSAYSGSYARTGQPVRELSVAPGDSLEGRAFVGQDFDAIYMSRKQLQRFGSIQARLRSDFKAAKWSDVLDGMLIFRKENPPDFIRH